MNIRRLSTIAAALSLVTSGALLAAMPPAQNWEIGPWVRGKNYSQGMPANPAPGPGGSLQFDFPLAGQGQVDALTTNVGPLSGARQIVMRYRVDASRGARLVPHETPGEQATISLYFQQAGDTWSGKGKYASYRWYVPGHAVIPLTPGEHTVTVGLDERWTNVFGVGNDADRQGYAAALAQTAKIGVAFGSVGRRSHGVYATAPARFTLIDLDIR
ncbi:hypothetical protein [Tsuneonella sp. HG222]